MARAYPPRPPVELEQTISKRALILGAGKLVLTGALISRLGFLQLWQAPHYKTLSEKNRIKLRLLPPRRGLLLDRNGETLAKNMKTFHALITPYQVGQSGLFWGPLQEALALTPEVLESIQARFRKAPRHLPFLIKDHLTWEEVSRLEIVAGALPGLSVEDGLERSYPCADATSHVLGYVQPVRPEDTDDRDLLRLPNFKSGKTGVERILDPQLRGAAGYQEEEVDARNRAVRRLSCHPATPGRDARLTLDARLQSYVHTRLSAYHSASAVVMDVHTGGVLCLSSTPGFDPNIFSKPITHTTWDTLVQDPYKPLVNKAVQGEYAPGSIFKLVVSLAALEAGVIHPHTQVYCGGHRQIGDRKFHCWHASGHGAVTLEQAIAKSCDVYYYDIALQLGADRIAHYARAFGLGQSTGIELTSERPGLVPDKAWKSKSRGQSWTIGETANMGIGQGYLLTTPLQLAVLMARLVNGGRGVSPTLVLGQTKHNAPDLPIAPAHLDLIRKAMAQTVNAPTGTGYRHRLDDPLFRYGGKTSTTQVRRITAEERRLGLHRQERPWHWRDHALFSGFAPLESPRYAVSVVVEHGGWGGAVAGPIVRDIMQQLRDIEKDAPVCPLS